MQPGWMRVCPTLGQALSATGRFDEEETIRCWDGLYIQVLGWIWNEPGVGMKDVPLAFSAVTCVSRLKGGRVLAQGLGCITRWGGAVLWRDSCHTHLVLGDLKALGPWCEGWTG
jgi:hypothetical protein